MQKDINETITALATAPGTAGLAVIRISGTDAIIIADKLFKGKKELKEAASHTIHYGEFYDDDILLDSVTASIFKAPNSYTGQDIVEISSHGGMLIVEGIISTLIKNGARLASPGEFTKRAFLNGKLDLIQAEAVADLIHSSSIPGARTAARQLHGEFTKRMLVLKEKLINIAAMLELELDFADEDIELLSKAEIKETIEDVYDFCVRLTDSYHSSEILRSGYYVGIAGFPNSGKSTLFNALLKRKRAIVSETPGTTRDFLEETLLLNGISVKIVDTAGLRESQDLIEIQGIKLAETILEQSDLILIINDISKGLSNSDNLFHKLENKFPDTKIVLLQNKIDLAEAQSGILSRNGRDEIFISAKNEQAIEYVTEIIENNAKLSSDRINDVLLNQRHTHLLGQAASHLKAALNALEEYSENEIIAIDIRAAVNKFGELSGTIWSDDILELVFSRFCIGK